jgi:hypothetical protein
VRVSIQSDLYAVTASTKHGCSGREAASRPPRSCSTLGAAAALRRPPSPGANAGDMGARGAITSEARGATTRDRKTTNGDRAHDDSCPPPPTLDRTPGVLKQIMIQRRRSASLPQVTFAPRGVLAGRDWGARLHLTCVRAQSAHMACQRRDNVREGMC